MKLYWQDKQTFEGSLMWKNVLSQIELLQVNCPNKEQSNNCKRVIVLTCGCPYNNRHAEEELFQSWPWCCYWLMEAECSCEPEQEY
jgi:hypothetical protein